MLTVSLIALVAVVGGALLLNLVGSKGTGAADDSPALSGAMSADSLPADDEAAGGDVVGLGMLSTPGRVEPATEEWEALLPRLQDVVKAAPGDRNALRKLALAYYNLGLLDETVAVYQSLLAEKEDPVLRNRLGNTLRDMGDIAGAEQAYRKAIGADPSLAPPYVNLAELLWRQGKDEEAAATVRQGLESVPEEGAARLREARQFLAGDD